MMAPVSVSVPVGSVMVSGATDTAARFATPVPVSVTTAGSTVAPVYATVSVRLYAVWFVGANTTLMVHDAPTANVAAPLAGQVPPAVPVGREKRCGVPPPKVKDPPASCTLPTLVTVRVNALLVVPVAQLPKASGFGLTEALASGATVFPVIVTGELLTPAIETLPSGRPPSLRTTAGAEVYPLPPLVTLIAVTAPPVMTAVAEAPIPPPPMRRTVGADVYRLPPLVTLIALILPAVTTAVAVDVAVAGTGLQSALIVHEAPAANAPPVTQLPGTLVTRTNGPVMVGAGMMNVVVPLFDSVKSRVGAVVVPEPATISVNPSGAGLAATSVLPAAIWYSTAPTSAGFVEILGRGLPKKSVAGAPALVPLLTAADVPAIEYAPPVAPTLAEATISSGAVGVVTLGRLRVNGP